MKQRLRLPSECPDVFRGLVDEICTSAAFKKIGDEIKKAQEPNQLWEFLSFVPYRVEAVERPGKTIDITLRPLVDAVGKPFHEECWTEMQWFLDSDSKYASVKVGDILAIPIEREWAPLAGAKV